MATETHSRTGAEFSYEYPSRVTVLFGAFTAVAVLGWLVSTFLTGIHLWALPLPETVEPSGSMLVITSEWAYVLGVPLALFGALYYLVTILMAGFWFETRHPLIIKLLTPITASGVVASSMFVYLQLFVIEAICPFCMVSAAATVVLFGLELSILKTSDLPSLSVLLDDPAAPLRGLTVTWPLLMAVTGLLAIGAFYAVTLAPVPGT